MQSTGGRAGRSAQACPGQPVVAQKDTEYNSPLQPWSRDCLRLQHTNCYKVKISEEKYWQYLAAAAAAAAQKETMNWFLLRSERSDT